MTRITTPFGRQSTAAEVVGRDRPGRPAGRSSPAAPPASAWRRRGRWPRAGAEVTLAVRDIEAGARVAADIAATTGNRSVDVAPLDLADRASVARVRRRVGRPAAHPRQQRRRDGARPSSTRPRAGSCSSRPTTSATSPWPSACTTRWPPPAAPGSSRSAPAAHLLSPVVFDDLHFALPPLRPVAGLRPVQDRERALRRRRHRALGAATASPPTR